MHLSSISGDTPFSHRKLKHIKSPQRRAGAGNGNTPLISLAHNAHKFGLRVFVTRRRKIINAGDRYDQTGTYRYKKTKKRKPLSTNCSTIRIESKTTTIYRLTPKQVSPDLRAMGQQFTAVPGGSRQLNAYNTPQERSTVVVLVVPLSLSGFGSHKYKTKTKLTHIVYYKYQQRSLQR